MVGSSVTGLARWLPYLLFGLLSGVVVDRYQRQPILVGADLARAVVLGVIPLCAALDVLAQWWRARW